MGLRSSARAQPAPHHRERVESVLLARDPGVCAAGGRAPRCVRMGRRRFRHERCRGSGGRARSVFLIRTWSDSPLMVIDPSPSKRPAAQAISSSRVGYV